MASDKVQWHTEKKNEVTIPGQFEIHVDIGFGGILKDKRESMSEDEEKD